MWSVLEGGGPLLLEEPELSLHPEVVRRLPQLFARVQRRTGRQVILSTHSRDLLADEGIGVDEVFVLVPSDEGTHVRVAGSIERLSKLLDSGFSLPEALAPYSRPDGIQRLDLLDTSGGAGG